MLQYVDVLLPFGFARDSSFDTLTDIQEVVIDISSSYHIGL